MSDFNSCSSNYFEKEKSYEDKLKTYLSKLYLYTWNSTYKRIEESYFKYESNEILINFDKESTNKFSYVGTCNIEEHAIFINVISEDDKDQCLIIFMNNRSFDHEYEKIYFNIGIMLSYGRRSQFPEAKIIFACQEKLNVNNFLLNNLVKNQLKKFNIDPNFLKECSNKIIRW